MDPAKAGNLELSLAVTLRAAAVVVTLFAAVLSQGMTPHLHASEEVGEHLHSQTQDCHETIAGFEAECLACRSGSRLRADTVTSNVSVVAPRFDSRLRAASPGAQSLLTRLLRIASPPRAPPA